MRFYSIKITGVDGTLMVPPSLRAAQANLGSSSSLSSLLANGQFNPSALNIELDIPEYTNHATDTTAYLKIWGVGLQDISSAFNLNGAGIEVSAGMSQGLPLANPQQQGLLVRGEIQQAFGNWLGTEMTVDLYMRPATGTHDAPRNYILEWRKGMPLQTALAQTFKTALPGFKQTFNIKQNLVLNHDEVGYYPTLGSFAEAINRMTSSFYPAGSDGIRIYTNGETVTAWDGAVQPASKVKEIGFQDLLGQATWSEPKIIIFKVVMRGDLSLNDVIQLPAGLRKITGPAMTFADPKNVSTFQGPFQIVRMQHWGNFRAPDAMSWNTTVWATPWKGPSS